MSTPTIDLIYRHGSARHYKSDPVPEETIREIVSCGQRASTSSNLQTYSVVVTTDPNKKNKLQEIASGQRHVGEAPVVLIWCADFRRMEQICESQGYQLEAGYLENFMVAAIDAAIAAQNAALAAESLGLGICYIGALRNDPRGLREIFELPHLVYPIFGMTLGWPVKTPRTRPRLPVDAVLHWETYRDSDPDLLLDYDQAMIDTGIYRGRQIDRSDIEPAEYGWMEHSARRVSKISRPFLRDTVLESGFELK